MSCLPEPKKTNKGGLEEPMDIGDETVRKKRTSPLEALETESEKLLQEHKSSTSDLINSIKGLLENAEHISKSLEQAIVQKDQFKQVSACNMVKEFLSVTYVNENKVNTTSQENFKKRINKFEKAIKLPFSSKNAHPDLESVWDPRAFDDKPEVLNSAIARHLVRDGKIEVAQAFASEANIEFPLDLTLQIAEMHSISQDLSDRKLENAIRWCQGKRHGLALIGSHLEFSLLSLYYYNLLLSQSPTAAADAMECFRKSIQPLISNSWPCTLCKEIVAKNKENASNNIKSEPLISIDLDFYTDNYDDKPEKSKKDEAKVPCRALYDNSYQLQAKKLLGMLAYYKKGFNNSPYKDMFNESHWEDARSMFVKNYCQLLGISSESPLSSAVLAGTLAMPAIIKMSSLLSSKSGLEWSQLDEFPIELPVLNNMNYHSVFVCPVSKEHTSETNPPMRLTCGHVICKECVSKLSKGTALRFKCPYCPTESFSSQAKKIQI